MKEVLDALPSANRGTVSMFLALVGVEGHDGNPLTVEEAWELARCFEQKRGAP